MKKRIERATIDPRMIVLTYEGKHNHYSHALVNGAKCAWYVSPSFLPIIVAPPSAHFIQPNHNHYTHTHMNGVKHAWYVSPSFIPIMNAPPSAHSIQPQYTSPNMDTTVVKSMHV